jgi:hypothetical protein
MRPFEPDYDTVIVPAREEGFQKVFLGERKWYPLRLSEESRLRLKFVAIYRSAPISAVTHYAPIERVVALERQRWLVELGEATEIEPVRFVTDGRTPTIQTPRFTALAKLLSADMLNSLLRQR